MDYNTERKIIEHGFWGMARTNLHQQLGFAPQVIQYHLVHRALGFLETAYNRTKFIKERRIVQRWSDYIDKLRPGADVLALSYGKVASWIAVASPTGAVCSKPRRADSSLMANMHTSTVKLPTYPMYSLDRFSCFIRPCERELLVRKDLRKKTFVS